MKKAESIDLKAKKFAYIAHNGQTYGPYEPYTAHLDAVAALVGDNNTIKAIAYLHDVVEDTPVQLAVVKETFGTFIAECVAILTDEPGKNRKERKAVSHAKLAKVDIDHYAALIVKVADRTANVEACVRKCNTSLLQMYRREQKAFRLAAYRPGLCDDLWNRINVALEAVKEAARPSTIMPVDCPYCRRVWDQIDGQGVTGTTSRICPEQACQDEFKRIFYAEQSA